MGLSKDDINIIEEVKILELTSAQKRRLRRKKLKEARSGSLESDSETQKDSFDLKKHCSKPDPNLDGQVIIKKQKHKCGDSKVLSKCQSSVSEDPVLINDQKPTSDIVSKDLNHKSQNRTLIKNNTKACKDILKNEKPHLIKKQNNTFECKLFKSKKTALTETKQSKCENIVTKKKKKSKNSGKTEQTKSKDISEEKNNSNSSLLIENHTANNLNITDKQDTVSESFFTTEKQKPESQDKVDIENHIANNQDHILVEKPESEILTTIGYDSIKPQDLKLEEQELKTIEILTLDEQDMGKLQDAQGTQKPQQAAVNKEQSKQDTGETATTVSAKSRDDVKAAREAKKLAKQKAKKKNDTIDENSQEKTVSAKVDHSTALAKDEVIKTADTPISKEEISIETVNDVKHKEIIPPKNIEIPVEIVTNKLDGLSTEDVKNESTLEKSDDKVGGKSKAELRAERRAKQEAQRAAKQAATQNAPAPEPKDKEPVKSTEEKSPKAKSIEKSKSKTQSVQKVGWFQNLYVEKDKDSLKNIPINSNLHPAVVKLGVQLASHVVTGSNARCIALLNAIKKMVRDYSLPARTEVGRGLQAQLAAAEAFLWTRRPPSAPETNALKHFRRQLTQLPANVDEFDAKKKLQEEIDRYIREQIDMAGEAISLILRKKISPDDHILTYGCSSLIERVLCSAWAAGVRFRATVAGARGQHGPEMLRRLRARGVPACYVDIAAISYVMNDVQKVVLGAGALLAHGAALGAAGSAQVALVARERNVPVLVACETHKFSERTHLDPLVCHEIGDPDDIIDKTDENSPLKDWRSNPKLTLLNVTYDVTPPSLITAVVTELGILPCTSAPVVLRFKQSEYGI